jgi:hypothetical protein
LVALTIYPTLYLWSFSWSFHPIQCKQEASLLLYVRSWKSLGSFICVEEVEVAAYTLTSFPFPGLALPVGFLVLLEVMVRPSVRLVHSRVSL